MTCGLVSDGPSMVHKLARKWAASFVRIDCLLSVHLRWLFWHSEHSRQQWATKGISATNLCEQELINDDRKYHIVIRTMSLSTKYPRIFETTPHWIKCYEMGVACNRNNSSIYARIFDSLVSLLLLNSMKSKRKAFCNILNASDPRSFGATILWSLFAKCYPSPFGWYLNRCHSIMRL